MKFYYTGATIKDGIQPNPLQSLGGFVSGNVVPNGRENSLFSEISLQESTEGTYGLIGLILKNDTGATVTNVKIYADVAPTAVSKYEISAVTVGAAGNIEKINDTKSLPYIGTFFDIMGNANERTLTTSLDNGAMIGIWLKRTVEPIAQKSCDVLYKDKDKIIETSEDLKLVLNYT